MWVTEYLSNVDVQPTHNFIHILLSKLILWDYKHLNSK